MPRPIPNLIGTTIGKLTIVREGPRLSNGKSTTASWICRCVCGKEDAIRTGNLRNRQIGIRNCNCEKLPKKDWSGYRTGRLLVAAFLCYDKVRGQKYLCKCDCGNITTVSLPHLLGNTRSCGCLQHELKSLPSGSAAKNRVIGRYKREAQERELPWEISDQKFFEIVSQKCGYCGVTPSTEYSNNCNGSFFYNGIDRIENEIGYCSHNVIACCATCNLMKRTWSKNYFINHISKIYQNLGGVQS